MHLARSTKTQLLTCADSKMNFLITALVFSAFNSATTTATPVKIASGDPSPFLEFALHKQTTIASDDSWKFVMDDWNSDGIPDLFCIHRQGDSLKTEVHILNGADKYTSFLLQKATILGSSGDNFDFTVSDFNGDGYPDLWAIKKSSTGSDSTEVHILNGRNAFQSWLLHTATPLHETGVDWEFHAADWNKDGVSDLVVIKKRGAVGTEIHVLDGASKFQRFNLQSRTALGFTSDDSWVFGVADYDGDGTMDVYALKKDGKDNKTEIRVLSGEGNFQRYLWQGKTGLHTTSESWCFLISDYDKDGRNDIISINNGRPYYVTVHVLRSATRTRRWSDPSIWGSNQGLGLDSIPTENDTAIIPTGKTLRLDTSATVRGIRLEGKIVVSGTSDLSLACDWFLIDNGHFQAGTSKHPFKKMLTISLTGTGPATVDTGNGEKIDDNSFIMVRGSQAKLDLHGISAKKVSWTQLDESMEVGTKSIKLKDAVSWEAGDRIVVASTDFDMNQAEEFTVVNIGSDKRSIAVDKAAKYSHFGRLQSYSNERLSWLLDERAEVGLLNRNIVIEGASAGTSKYGGHVIVMEDALARVEGCEFRQMGQKGIVGKYPFHWHMLGPTQGQYFKDNSIHHTFNRAVTIHGSANVLVQGNVAYDHIGHGYFLEDGSEYGNVFLDNLGLVTRKMSVEEATIPTDNTHVSTFWISNPDNTFRGNSAAGSDHGGFWFALPKRPTGLSASQTHIRPINTPLKDFNNNIGHSSEMNLSFDGSPNPTTLKLDGGRYGPRDSQGKLFIPKITNFTSYKSTDRGIWMRADTFEFHDIKSGDNTRGTFFAYSQHLRDSLIVGRSLNTDPNDGRKYCGHSIYDGPCGVDGVHFAGFSSKNDYALQTNGAATKSTVHWAKRVSFDEGIPRAHKVDFTPATFMGYMWSSGLHDLDGSVSGRSGAILTPIISNYPNSGRSNDKLFNVAANATQVPEWGCWLNENAHFGLLMVHPSWAKNSAERITITRCGGSEPCQSVLDVGTYRWYYQNPVIVDKDYIYTFSFQQYPASFGVALRYTDEGQGVLVKFANIPTTTRVEGGKKVNSINEVRRATTSSYCIVNGHLWIKHVTSGLVTDPQSTRNQPFGMVYSASASVRVVTFDGSQDRVNIVKDFTTGVDPNGSLAAANGPSFRGIHTGWGDTINWWDVLSAADGRNGFVDYRYSLASPQDWRYFQSFRVDTKLAGEKKSPSKEYSFQVFIYDSENGYSNLGKCTSGECLLSLADVAEDKLDSVAHILIRVHISFFAELDTVGAFQRVHLYSIGVV